MVGPELARLALLAEQYGARFTGPCLTVWSDTDGCPPLDLRGRRDEHMCLAPAAYPHPCRCVRCGHPNGAAQ